MTFKTYRDVHLFYRDTRAVLMRHEEKNIVTLGNILIGRRGQDTAGWRDPKNWLMAVLSDESGIRLAAVMTPPHCLTLCAADDAYSDAHLQCLSNGLAETGISIGGVMAENALSEGFARHYTKARGLRYEILERQRIYQLLRVTPGLEKPGPVRLARESDMAFLPYWLEGFNNDCFGSSPPVESLADEARYHIASGQLYILEDQSTPVSMAKITREVETACCVGYVYTPPYFRAKGHATACVAAVSRLMLERGFLKCVLYTDLANPTSNSIYQTIGYRPVCDSLEIRFTEAS